MPSNTYVNRLQQVLADGDVTNKPVPTPPPGRMYDIDANKVVPEATDTGATLSALNSGGFRSQGGVTATTTNGQSPPVSDDPEPPHDDPAAWLAWRRRQSDRAEAMGPPAPDPAAEDRKKAEHDRRVNVVMQQMREQYGPAGRDMSDDDLRQLAEDSVNADQPGLNPAEQQTPADQPVADSGSQPAPNAQPSAPPPQWVEAHELYGVNPERQAALENAYGDEAKARLQAGDIMANGQAVGADQQMAAARQELADEDQIAQNRDARHAYLDRLAADVESDSKDLANSKVDPDRYWHSRTTPQAIFGVIGMALGGFLQGFRGGRNPAADQIQSLIENDIKAQRDNLENKWESVRMKHSLLADKAARYNSLDIAERQQVAARLQGAVLMANAAAARATSPVERANALALASQLEQKAIESGITMNKWVNAGYAGGGAPGKIAKDVKPANLVRIGDQWVDTGDATTALNFSKQNISADHIIDQAQSLIQLLQDPETLNPFSSKRGPLNAISKQISIDDMNEAGGGQRGGVGYMRFLNEAQGPASSFLPYKRQQAIAALQQFINKAVADKEARARSLSGAPVVSRNVDLQNQKVDYQYTGTFNPTSGASSASPDSVGYKRVGQ